jgi:hypothetical protein
MHTLLLVHCVDTEGPLYESLEATFERLFTMTGVRLSPRLQTLAALRRGEIDLGGKEAVVQLALSEHLLAYNDTWDRVDSMLTDMMSDAFRQRFSDPHGGPWTFSWFCVDHVGYTVNPRRRDIGYHNVFDHYRALLREHDVPDEIHWHVHPMSTYAEAHRNATSYMRSPHVLETLARRVIDRSWFPVAFRPGFHVERPDSHWLLEQFVPFDYGNQARADGDLEDQQLDLADGRFGDWRRAPADWSHYQPHHDDYQVPGGCRRTIFRCLNVGTRLRLLDEGEVRKAFARAAQGRDTVLAFTDHDFRDMRPDVAAVHDLVRRVAPDYPSVEWRNSGALAAARAVLGRQPREPLVMNVEFRRQGDSLRLEAESSHPIFGPQPFLAVKSHSQQYGYDNLDIQEPFRRWSYVFDEQSFRPASIEALGLAAADDSGQIAVVRFDGSGRPLSAHSP